MVDSIFFRLRIAEHHIVKHNIARLCRQDLPPQIGLFGFVQKAEYAVGGGQTTLQGGHYAGHAFDGVEHHQHGGEKRHKITGGEAGMCGAAGGEVENNRQRNGNQQLGYGAADGTGRRLLHNIMAQFLVLPCQAALLVRLAAIHTHHAGAVDGFTQYLHDMPHHLLVLVRQPTQAFVDFTHAPANHRQGNKGNQG